MGDYLRLSIKGRTCDGVWEELKKAYIDGAEGPQGSASRLKEIIEVWLKDEMRSPDEPAENQPNLNKPILAVKISDAIMNHVCDISGHTWAEWIEDVNHPSEIYGFVELAEDKSQVDSRKNNSLLNIHTAEFLPKGFDLKKVNKVLGAKRGMVNWSDVSGQRLCALFSELFESTDTEKKDIVDSEKKAQGAVPGEIKKYPPQKVQMQSDSWHKDRHKPRTTPSWETQKTGEIIESWIQDENEKNWLYSFTPGLKPEKWSNCLTFASRVPDQLGIDWLETIANQCNTGNIRLDLQGCTSHNVRVDGRMKCGLRYVEVADEMRRGGRLTF
ncbi:MAG: hypothetical protein WBV94_00385 [Blastocatellia bacterium]